MGACLEEEVHFLGRKRTWSYFGSGRDVCGRVGLPFLCFQSVKCVDLSEGCAAGVEAGPTSRYGIHYPFLELPDSALFVPALPEGRSRKHNA